MADRSPSNIEEQVVHPVELITSIDCVAPGLGVDVVGTPQPENLVGEHRAIEVVVAVRTVIAIGTSPESSGRPTAGPARA